MGRLRSVENTDELGSYLDQISDRYPKDFSSYIKAVLAEKGMSVADLQRASCIDRNYIYQIVDGSKHPGRDKIIAIAIGCRMDLKECQRALEITNEGILYAKSRRDSLVIYAINNGLSVMSLNALLEEYKLPLIE